MFRGIISSILAGGGVWNYSLKRSSNNNYFHYIPREIFLEKDTQGTGLFYIYYICFSHSVIQKILLDVWRGYVIKQNYVN